jgi:hypothetical protein
MFELKPCHYYEGFSKFFLHIMVVQNPKKSKKSFFLVSYDVMLEYIYTKTNDQCNVLKNAIDSKND